MGWPEGEFHGLKGQQVELDLCQGSKPEMSEGARRNGMGSPALSPHWKCLALPGAPQSSGEMRDRASFPTGTRSPQEAPLAPRPPCKQPFLGSDFMLSAAGPQGPSSLIHTILISVFSSYGERKKSICAAWLPALRPQRQTFTLPVCSLSSNPGCRPCRTQARAATALMRRLPT